MDKKDFYRLSYETNKQLMFVVNDAMKELKGDAELEEAIKNDLFVHLLPLQLMAGKQEARIFQRGLKYVKMKLHELLRELYLRMHTYYHYGACHGRELPGISWKMENNDVFVITLKDCAVNLEHSVKDDNSTKTGRLFCIGLNVAALEVEDPENPDSDMYGEYDEFLNFCCEFKDDDGNIECKDVYFMDEWYYEDVLRDVLAGLDLISDIANEVSGI